MNIVSSSLSAQSSSAPEGHAPSPRLVSAAHEFEASLMQELLKPMQEDPLFGEVGDSSDSTHGSNETLMSFGSQALARALSEHGGLGIATEVLRHFREGAAMESDKTATASMPVQRRTAGNS